MQNMNLLCMHTLRTYRMRGAWWLLILLVTHAIREAICHSASVQIAGQMQTGKGTLWPTLVRWQRYKSQKGHGSGNKRGPECTWLHYGEEMTFNTGPDGLDSALMAKITTMNMIKTWQLSESSVGGEWQQVQDCFPYLITRVNDSQSACVNCLKLFLLRYAKEQYSIAKQ